MTGKLILLAAALVAQVVYGGIVPKTINLLDEWVYLGL